MDTDDNSYSDLGLVRDPFATDAEGSGDATGIRLAIDAAVDRTLRTFRQESSIDGAPGVLLVKSSRLPASYSIAILTRVTSGLMRDGAYGSGLFLHVPLDMMRLGRVRAVLNTTAESFAGRSPHLTLGPWVAGLFEAAGSPDGSLPEGLDDAAFASFREEFLADAGAAFCRYFGEPEMLRMDADADDMGMLMRLSSSRQDALESDPDETFDPQGSRDDVEDDPLRDAFTTVLLDSAECVEQSTGEDADVVEAFRNWVGSRAHDLSPVFARGLEAYIAQGMASMTEELKISQAPTRTLLVLLRILAGRYDTIAVAFDRLDMWPGVPQELRDRILQTMRSLRDAMAGLAVFSVILDPEDAPEVAEAFSDAVRVGWDLPEAERFFSPGAMFDAAVAGAWLESATLSGEVPAWGAPLIAAVPGDVTIEQGCEMLSAALRTALAQGREPLPADISAALAPPEATN